MASSSVAFRLSTVLLCFEHVTSISKSKRFHSTHYNSAGLILIVVSCFQISASVLSETLELMAHWRDQERDRSPSPPPSPPRRRARRKARDGLPQKKKVQSPKISLNETPFKERLVRFIYFYFLSIFRLPAVRLF